MSAEKRDLLDSLVLRAPAVGTAVTAGLVRLKLGSPLSRATASRWIRQARDAGFLGPAKRGKAST